MRIDNIGHVDRALTNMSVAYVQNANAFVADKVFPQISVQKRSDLFFKYSKEDFLRDEFKERARGVESVGTDFSVGEDTYFCKKYALHIDVTPEEVVNADAPLNPVRDATLNLTQKFLINRERNFASKFFNTGLWGTDAVGTTDFTKFSDPASMPVNVIKGYIQQVTANTGYRPNFMVVSPDVQTVLEEHGEIIDRIKYTTSGGAIVTNQLLAALFGVDEYYVPYAVVDSSQRKPAYAAPGNTTDFIFKGKILLGYKTATPSLHSPTAGATFAWTGLEGAGAYGGRVNRLSMDQLGIGTQRIEYEGAYDQKIIAKDMGVLLSAVI